MNNLQVQQNMAAKLIQDKPKYSSATEGLKELEWKHLAHRRHLHRCVFIFRCLHKIIDINFNFKQNNAIHHYKYLPVQESAPFCSQNKLRKAKNHIPSSCRF